MDEVIQSIRKNSHPLDGGPLDFDPLLQRCEGKRLVLLGESSHGTHEFYAARAEITRRLIVEKGFHAIALEADWPDAWRVGQFVKGSSTDQSATDALSGFKRFPQWMWRNSDMLDFVGWLRSHNDSCLQESDKVGVYGLDLYSLQDSMNEVLRYLKDVDPEAAGHFKKRYACFEHFGGDTQRYGLFTGTGVAKSCEEEVISALAELRRSRGGYLGLDGRTAEEAFFCAEQNASVVANAENYYRTMLRGDVASWNLRDRHMMDTLLATMTHLDTIHQESKIVVWAHNSHIGHAGATQMGRRGEFNIGQLVREKFGDEALLVGFTTHAGTVTAAADWDAPAERRVIKPSLPHSYERMFHESGLPSFWLDFSEDAPLAARLRQPQLERAIGVIYRPESERQSHYFTASLADQFDAVFHYDQTRAVEPLERTGVWEAGEVDETYPSGL
jgi:erythromycin esterase-like protein